MRMMYSLILLYQLILCAKKRTKWQALLELLNRDFPTRLWDVCVSSRLEAAVIIQQLTGVMCILQAMIKARLHMMQQTKQFAVRQQI